MTCISEIFSLSCERLRLRYGEKKQHLLEMFDKIFGRDVTNHCNNLEFDVFPDIWNIWYISDFDTAIIVGNKACQCYQNPMFNLGYCITKWYNMWFHSITATWSTVCLSFAARSTALETAASISKGWPNVDDMVEFHILITFPWPNKKRNGLRPHNSGHFSSIPIIHLGWMILCRAIPT